jgi:hypothetical protein
MSYQRLLIFCEGPDDERFFNAVVRPRLSDAYDRIRTVPHAKRDAEKIGRYIRTAQQRSIDLLFVRDVDQAPCITACIEAIRSTFGEHLSPESIYVVVKEIESWYAAGMSRQRTEEMLGRPLQRTDDLTKERLNDLLPDDTSRIDYMQRLLSYFDVDRARAKNHSFEYFCSAVLD